MAKSATRARRRARALADQSVSVHVSLAPELQAQVKKFIAAQKDHPSRSEAIRRLIGLGLEALRPTKKISPKARARAHDLAGQQIEKLIDPSAPHEERERRKRRLLKGPKEF